MKHLNFIFQKLLRYAVFYTITLVVGQSLVAQNAKLSVDALKVLKGITPLMYGSCIEDVNHEIYGGLYDQKIFGESLEEPSVNINSEFDMFEGTWPVKDSVISVSRWAGAKLISKVSEFNNGSAEVNVKFLGTSGDNAGLIFHVSTPGNGADNFNGYEISLLNNGTRLRLGKHLHNYTFLTEVDVAFNPLDWTNLRVGMQGSRIQVFVNKAATPTIDYTDNSSPILSGTVGIRTWNSDVSFSNLIIRTPTDTTVCDFSVTSKLFVSNCWDIVKSTNDSVEYNVDNDNPFNGANSQLINYVKGTHKAGIANKSLNRWGISVKEGQKFQGRLYLRSKNFNGSVTLSLQSFDGTINYADTTISQLTSDWKKYPFTLTSNTTDPKAKFVILMDNVGTIWVDQVVLMQTGDQQFKGLPYRADIGKAMVNEGLTFLRYGGTMVNAPGYRFKKMIGDPDQRPIYEGNWYKYSTNGFGIEDFLKFCEAAHFTGAFAINIEETGADAADMVEYLNGEITTTWGAKRAVSGHPEPYKVRYIEIGNEEVIGADDLNGYQHYLDRFNELYSAMHAKDPSIKFIATPWWRPGSVNMETVFKGINGKASYWDYHPWADDATSGTTIDIDLTTMQSYFLNWDPNTTLKCAIFEENGNLHNMQRALGHATILNAVRRHSDFLLTSCPANALQPYLQNDNGWDQGQIFFTPSQAWEMPPFYAQQMASKNHLPSLISSGKVSDLDITATRSENADTVVLHVINTSGATKKITINVNGFPTPFTEISTYTLKGTLTTENTPTNPEACKTIGSFVEHAKADSFVYTFPEYSYTILRLAPSSFTTSVNKLMRNKLYIYPSPAQDFIQITGDDDANFDIMDMDGTNVLTKRILGSGKINISGLHAGIYFVKLKGISNNSILKFVKY
jgi:alpha-L-arabinofuranosidase